MNRDYFNSCNYYVTWSTYLLDNANETYYGSDIDVVLAAAEYERLWYYDFQIDKVRQDTGTRWYLRK